MWQSTYSYDDSQTFAYGYQSSGSHGFDSQCEIDAPQHDNYPRHNDDAPQHDDLPQHDGLSQHDAQPGGLGHDDFQPQDFHYGDHYEVQEFHYYHSEHHVDSSAFHA